MASEENKRLQAAIAPVMKVHGFKKTGATWRRNRDDVISVLNIQGSQWSRTFYINLGIYYEKIGDMDKPCEYQCHLRTRLAEVVGNRDQVDDLLDFENDIPETVRIPEIVNQIEVFAIPWFGIMESVNGAKGFILAQPGNAWWVTQDAKKFLGIEECDEQCVAPKTRK